MANGKDARVSAQVGKSRLALSCMPALFKPRARSSAWILLSAITVDHVRQRLLWAQILIARLIGPLDVVPFCRGPPGKPRGIMDVDSKFSEEDSADRGVLERMK